MTTTFEIHVEGELAAPTLHHLGCTHCIEEAQTVVRLKATPTDLQRLVRRCSDYGMTIESIVRLDAP